MEQMLSTSSFSLAHNVFLTHYQTTNLEFSKLKEFADDNFKFEGHGRKLIKWVEKWVENTVGKGEIACFKQFLLFHSVFKRLVSQGHQKVSLCGNGLRGFIPSVVETELHGKG